MKSDTMKLENINVTNSNLTGLKLNVLHHSKFQINGPHIPGQAASSGQLSTRPICINNIRSCDRNT